MRRLKVVLVVAVLLLVTSCSSPVTPDIWNGETTNSDTGAVQGLRLEVVNRSDSWRGSYYVEAARGAFDGTNDNGVLTATLIASDTCTFELNGTVTGDALTATFEPTDCPGGNTGTWALNRL